LQKNFELLRHGLCPPVTDRVKYNWLDSPWALNVRSNSYSVWSVCGFIRGAYRSDLCFFGTVFAICHFFHSFAPIRLPSSDIFASIFPDPP
jgi:hypothetical protein